jgi:DNA-binding IclR family transcriptional regulator
MARGGSTIKRVMATLNYVADSQRSIRVSAMASALNLPQSTTHRIINQFVTLGLLRRSSGTRQYETTIKAFRLGASISQKLNDVVGIAMPSLHRIVQISKESCALGLCADADGAMFFAAQIQSPHPLRHYVNLFTRESVLWGTSGRAILAHLPPDMPVKLLEEKPTSPTGLQPLKLASLQDEIEQVRQRGYALSNRGERVPDASGIATPIFSAPGRVIGCLALTTPSFRYSKQKEPLLVSLMKREAEKISAELSGRPLPFRLFGSKTNGDP